MFNHVGHLLFVPEATDPQIEAIVDALLALPDRIDGLAEAQVMRDVGLVDGNGTHPAHVAVIARHFRSVLADRSFLQYEDAGLRSSAA